MTDHAVAIAGGGPTGMMVAAELRLAGVDVVIVEPRASQELTGSRGSGLHARTVEILDQRGIADRFLAEGTPYPVLAFNQSRLAIGDFPTRHNYTLGIWQNQVERILAGWVAELGVPFQRQREVTGFTQDEDHVRIELSDGGSLRAEYLVGCDGGRSVVRKAAGIDFPGWDATTSWLIAEAEFADEPRWGFYEDAAGTHAIGKRDEGGRVRVGVVLTEPRVGTGEPTLEEIRNGMVAVYGTDFGLHSPTWISRFSDMTRQAAAYRAGRVLLAGDSAHVHAPLGGQGLNLGVHDAVNLGWKLAQVVKGVSPASLLDSYHAERHPAGARVLRNTMAQAALRRTDERSKALSEMVSGLLEMDGPRRRIVGEISGLDVHYDLGEGHPLLGRRMPDLELLTADGPRRVYALLHEARPVLLDLTTPARLDVGPWSDRVRPVAATYDGAWELPVIGTVAGPTAVLIRPDGYVGWVGLGDDAGLVDALTRWFGPPTR
jgi:3-(3-hydroxy-phenyl)propionate hydroxylase